MGFVVYILYSQSLHKFYVGHTQDLVHRLEEHNSGRGDFTSKGAPWQLITTFACPDRGKAMRLEKAIKKRGISRFLSDSGMDS